MLKFMVEPVTAPLFFLNFMAQKGVIVEKVACFKLTVVKLCVIKMLRLLVRFVGWGTNLMAISETVETITPIANQQSDINGPLNDSSWSFK